MNRYQIFSCLWLATCLSGATALADEIPEKLKRWLEPQSWQRDTKGPVISLGKSGQFDDTHIFAPAVVQERGRYMLWFCGSGGAVSERVFRLGLATSKEGRSFTRHAGNPVFQMPDGNHSVLTPALLRSTDGQVLREDGRLRMWFSSTWFEGGDGLHTLHETRSVDGVHWDKPSEAQLKNVYAPTVIKNGDLYQAWYIDVGVPTWPVRQATSSNGRDWTVLKDPVLQVDQEWEKNRLFYPHVLMVDGVYLMWYGSYWNGHPNMTAVGCAVSLDGRNWTKHPDNPVLRPDPERPWESHYVTSHSVIRMDNGSFRIWYASRKKPPFVNKYFAINTATWKPR